MSDMDYQDIILCPTRLPNCVPEDCRTCGWKDSPPVVSADLIMRNALIKAIRDTYLAEWLAIFHNKTRTEYKQYIEDARELADYLTVIGYTYNER